MDTKKPVDSPGFLALLIVLVYIIAILLRYEESCHYAIDCLVQLSTRKGAGSIFRAPSPFNCNSGSGLSVLALTDSEHLRTAGGTDTLSRRLPVLHGYGLGILHLSLGTALHTIGFHTISSLVFPKTTTLTPSCQAGLYRSGVRTIPTPRIEQSVVQAQRKAAG